MKKLFAAFVVLAIMLVLPAIPASASYTMEDAVAADKVYRGTPEKITEGVIDPIWDNAKEYLLEGRLPESQNRIRPGLTVTFKHLWDDNNFYYLIKISGDKDVYVNGERLIGAFYADKTKVLLVTPVSLEDELYPEYYYPTYNGRTSDVSLKIHREDPQTAEEGGDWETSEWIMADTWGNESLQKSSESVIPQVLESLSIYETGDAEETYYVQVAIPWIDREYAKSGNIVGIDVAYEDNIYKQLADHLGLANASANCYYAEGWNESINNPLFAEPRVLSGLPVDIDAQTAEIINSIEYLDANKITIKDKDTIAEIKSKYEALTESQKKLVTNYQLLINAEERIAVLEAAKIKGEKVRDMIKALPENITLADEDSIIAIRNEYDALNADEKNFVTSSYLEILQKAETKIETLKGNNSSNSNNNGIADGEVSGGETQENNGSANPPAEGDAGSADSIPTTKDIIVTGGLLSAVLMLVSAVIFVASGKKLARNNK